MEELILIGVLTRIVKWILRSVFRLFVTAVFIGFLVWLFVIELGYGEIIKNYTIEFLNFLQAFMTAQPLN